MMNNVWRHVAEQSNDAQPAVAFGGDFNCSSIQSTMCLTELNSSRDSRKTVQSIHRKAAPLHGDTALAVNAIAFQADSGFGNSYNAKAFSDAHGVVLVPLCLIDKRANSSVVQPAPRAHRDPGAQKAQPPCPRTAPPPKAPPTNEPGVPPPKAPPTISQRPAPE